jgi:cell division protease FtsH
MDLGPAFGGAKDYSEETAREIDDEIKMIIEEAREKVRALLSEKKPLLDKVARTPLEKETIEGEDLRKFINNHSVEHEVN